MRRRTTANLDLLVAFLCGGLDGLILTLPNMFTIVISLQKWFRNGMIIDLVSFQRLASVEEKMKNVRIWYRVLGKKCPNRMGLRQNPK